MEKRGPYFYGRGMATPSFTLQSLTEIKRGRMRLCDGIESHTRQRHPYALAAALELQSIEKPRLPIDDRFTGLTHVAVHRTRDRSRIRGVRFAVWPAPWRTVTVDRRFECIDPICTWAMYATRLPLEELIVLGDAMMRRDRRLKRVRRDEFAAFLDEMREWLDGDEARKRNFRGIGNCRRALRIMRENTDSSQETRTRIALMRYGLDCPAVNHTVKDARGSKVLLDMAYPELRLAIEYDGAHHASQWLGDAARRAALEEAGWAYVQVTELDLVDERAEERLARRVADKMAQIVGVPMPLTERRTIRQVCDGRTTRRRPLWERAALGGEGEGLLVPAGGGANQAVPADGGPHRVIPADGTGSNRLGLIDGDASLPEPEESDPLAGIA